MACANVFAVDGPSAAGKTTTSTTIAEELDLSYLESGQGYRLLAYYALDTSTPITDEVAVISLCDRVFADDAQLNTSESTLTYLRSPDVSRAVSKVAKFPEVRARLTQLTRRWAQEQKACIIEGRDIGTVVFPDAAAKFYLDATPDVRATRRVKEERGRTYDEVLADVVRRDHEDSCRKESPLRPARDALVIDTSTLTVAQVVHRMLEICRPLVRP